MLPGFLIVLALSAAAPAAGADLAMLIKDCEACHGANGASTHGDVPTIAAISVIVHKDYLVAYQDKKRPCTQSKYRHGDTKRPETDMCAVAGKLTVADIDALARHFAGKPFVAAKSAFNAALVATGKTLHVRACERCHAGGGRDADVDASILAGQQAIYLKNAFAEFMSGKRPQPKKMKEKMAKLKPADIEALIQFYASQQ